MIPLRELIWRTSTAVTYRLRDFASGGLAQHCRPASIVLLLTERCNARCVHCDIWKNKGGEATPRVGEWQQLLSDLASWLGPAQVTLSGGEALLRPYTPALLAFGKQRGLLMELLTNGYWVDQSRVEQAALADPWRITVSVDGIGDIHNTVRGADGFPDSYGTVHSDHYAAPQGTESSLRNTAENRHYAPESPSCPRRS